MPLPLEQGFQNNWWSVEGLAGRQIIAKGERPLFWKVFGKCLPLTPPKNKPLNLQGLLNSKLVEAAGIEPASENLPTEHLHTYPVF